MQHSTASTRKATLIGATAILMWSSMATLTVFSGDIPPFALTAMALTIATGLILLKWSLFNPSPGAFFRFPRSVYGMGLLGIFGFHFFYFIGLRQAPAVEANLITYFWPLLIVVMSAFLPGERLRLWHVAGTAMAVTGTVVLVTAGGAEVGFDARYLPGYFAAFGAALCWSIFSIWSRRMATVPTDVVGVFCIYSAALAWVCHALFETWVWPGPGEWLVVLLLGLGPVGLAFFVWDHGVKRGDVRTLATAAYGTPLLSTLWLVLFGFAAPTSALALACLLIVAGAFLGGIETIAPRWVRRFSV